MITTVGMATTCEKHATSVDGAQATRLLRYAAAMRKCRRNSRCGMDACPRCNRRHVKRNVRLVEGLIRSILPESLRFLDFDIPGTVATQDIDRTIAGIVIAVTRLTKGNTLWARYFSRWAGQVRAKLEAAQGADSAAFRMSVRFVVEIQPAFDLTELQKRWRLLLHSLGLAPAENGDTALVHLVAAKGDAHQDATKLCRSTTSWLAPITALGAADVIAYHKVLPTLLSLRAHAGV